MEELIENLAQSNLTWSVALVIIAIVMRPVLLAALEFSRENVKAQRELERDRIANEKEQTRMLGLLKDELVVSRGINNQLMTSVGAIPDTLRAMQSQMSDRVGQADRKRDAIHTDVKTIPAEVWRLGDPKLDDIKTRIAALHETIQANIDPNAENARHVIQREFRAMTTRLSEIENIMRRFGPSEPGERKPPEETEDKMSEENTNNGH